MLKCVMESVRTTSALEGAVSVGRYQKQKQNTKPEYMKQLKY